MHLLWALLTQGAWSFSIFVRLNEALLHEKSSAMLTLIGQPNNEYRMTKKEVADWSTSIDLAMPAQIYLAYNDLILKAVLPDAADKNRGLIGGHFRHWMTTAMRVREYGSVEWKALLTKVQEKFDLPTVESTLTSICTAYHSYLESETQSELGDLLEFIQSLFKATKNPGQLVALFPAYEGIELVLHLCLQNEVFHAQYKIVKTSPQIAVSTQADGASVVTVPVHKKYLKALAELMILTFLTKNDPDDLIFIQEMWRPVTLANFAELRRLAKCTRFFWALAGQDAHMSSKALHGMYRSFKMEADIIPCASLYPRLLSGTLHLQKLAAVHPKRNHPYEGALDTLHPIQIGDGTPGPYDQLLPPESMLYNLHYDVLLAKWIHRCFTRIFTGAHAKIVIGIAENKPMHLLWLCEYAQWEGRMNNELSQKCSALRRKVVSRPPAKSDSDSTQEKTDPLPEADSVPEKVAGPLANLQTQQARYLTRFKKVRETQLTLDKHSLKLLAIGMAHYKNIFRYKTRIYLTTEYSFPENSVHFSCAYHRRQLRTNPSFTKVHDFWDFYKVLERVSVNSLIPCAFDHYAVHIYFRDRIAKQLSHGLHYKIKSCNL